MQKSKAYKELESLVNQRIVFLDGAMGTMIQQHKLEEEDFRGERFKDHNILIKGNNDLLSIVRPDIIEDIHMKYLEAGSDIIGTNTFSGTKIAQLDYGLEDLVYEINKKSAEIAKSACKKMMEKDPSRQCFVAGALGPTNRTASMSPDVNNPAFRAVTFDQLKNDYLEQIQALIEGGADIILPETTFDTLNIKAAIYAFKEFQETHHEKIPLMLSVTITDSSGRTLSGQTVEAFWNSVRHAEPFSVGINCALGASEMRPYMTELAKVSDCYTSCYPNAGLPNPLAATGYDETPDITSSILEEYAESGLINLVGGCCGTTPGHINAIVEKLRPIERRKKKDLREAMRLSGLEPLNIFEERATKLIMVGERTNVTGSPKFNRLIKEGNFDEALEIARQQVESGANILDVNFDEGMLDSVECMKRFLNLIASEPDIAKIPIMIDSSKWEVIFEGLKCVQGKAVVNSISLKEGEEKFIEHAKIIKKFGAAAVVMAFDEKGQAAERDHKVAICKRAYDILVEKVDFDPRDIIFDPNILTVATGIEEHNNYAVNFIEAVREIKKVCPGAMTSGGVSNISFSFRGNNVVREAMHSCFLYHAIKAGLDMGIVNAGMLEIYENINPELKEKVESVLLNKSDEATDDLLDFAEKFKGQSKKKDRKDDAWREKPLQERISHALVHGVLDHIEKDTAEALDELKAPLSVIEGPLMGGMKIVGELFGDGKMFLPQVVKSARVMKRAVAYLEPYMEEEKKRTGKSSQGVFLIATVKGDVHDIGKNIVGVVLACNGYKVIDMGVMVSCEDILKKAKEEDADIIGMSGLITPSLDEMIHNMQEMKRQGFEVPVLIGGATTSKAHTAIKIAPHYNQPVVHVGDASLVVEVCSDLLNQNKAGFVEKLMASQQNLRDQFEGKTSSKEDYTSLAEAKKKRDPINWDSIELFKPNFIGTKTFKNVNLDDIVPYIDWSPFFWTWELKGTYPKILENPKYGDKAQELFDDAQEVLKEVLDKRWFKPQAVIGIWPANSEENDITLYSDLERKTELDRFHFLRQQKKDSKFKSLADFVAPKGREDFCGSFVVTIGEEVEKISKRIQDEGDDYKSIMVKAIGDRLAEALAEWAHKKMRDLWGFGESEGLTNEELIKEKYRGSRPAPGYPSCPDHTEKRTIWKILDAEKHTGATLTENCAMYPASTVSGYYFQYPNEKYFNLGKVMDDQLEIYAKSKNMPLDEVKRWLAPNLLD